MVKRSTGFFAGWDLEKVDHVRALVSRLEAYRSTIPRQPGALPPANRGGVARTTSTRQSSIEMLDQHMGRSPLLTAIIDATLLSANLTTSGNTNILAAARIAEEYGNANTLNPGNPAYQEAEQRWLARAGVTSPTLIGLTPPGASRIFEPVRGQVIDDCDSDDAAMPERAEGSEKFPIAKSTSEGRHETQASSSSSKPKGKELEIIEPSSETIAIPRTSSRATRPPFPRPGRQSKYSPQEESSSAAERRVTGQEPSSQTPQITRDRQIARRLARMEAITAGIGLEDADNFEGSQQHAVLQNTNIRQGTRQVVPRGTPQASMGGGETISSSPAIIRSDNKKIARKLRGNGSKKAWVVSEKEKILELLRAQMLHHPDPKWSRLTNSFNDQMYNANVQQPATEKCLSTEKRETLGEIRRAPWRTKAAIMRKAMLWPERTAILQSAKPTWDEATQSQTEPTYTSGGIASDDDAEYPEPFTEATPKEKGKRKDGRKRKQATDADEREEEDNLPLKKAKSSARSPRTRGSRKGKEVATSEVQRDAAEEGSGEDAEDTEPSMMLRFTRRLSRSGGDENGSAVQNGRVTGIWSCERVVP